MGLTVKKRNIKGYESRSKDKLLRIIINNKRDRKSSIKSKKEETKKSICKPKTNSIFKLKSEKIKKCLNKPAKKPS